MRLGELGLGGWAAGASNRGHRCGRVVHNSRPTRLRWGYGIEDAPLSDTLHPGPLHTRVHGGPIKEFGWRFGELLCLL